MVVTGGCTFDETPLTFLDWLAGQDWFTGKAMVYVQTYLAHPSIQRQLDEELAQAEPKDSFIPTLDAVPQKDVNNPTPDPEWKRLRYLTPDEKRRADDLHQQYKRLLQARIDAGRSECFQGAFI